MVFHISLFLYFLGTFLVLYEIKARKIQFIINWPYLIYGVGFPVLIYFHENRLFHWLDNYLQSSKQILFAQILMLLFVILSHIIGDLILREKSLTSIFEEIEKKEIITTKIVNSLGFKVYSIINFILFLIIYILAWKNGELSSYNYREFEHYKYWGPLAFITENITILIVFYIYNLLFFGKHVRRSFLLEFIFAFFIILRILPGTRLFFAKILITFLVFSYLLKKLPIRYIFIISFIGLFIFAWIGFKRIGLEFNFSIFALLAPFLLEASWNDLTLINSIENLKGIVYFPLYPLYLIVSIIPSFLINKKEMLSFFFNKRIYEDKVGLDRVSPVGGMSFIGETVIAYGPFFFLLLIIFLIIVYNLIARIKTSIGLFFLFAISSVALNLWRDPVYISFKIMLEHVILNFFLMFSFYLYFKRCEGCSYGRKSSCDST